MGPWGYFASKGQGPRVRESTMKPVGKPDARNGHVRFDERGWETGRRFGVSTRAHPRLYAGLLVNASSSPAGGRIPVPNELCSRVLRST